MNPEGPIQSTATRLENLTAEEWTVMRALLHHPASTRTALTRTIPFGLSKTDALLRDLSVRGFVDFREADVVSKGRRPYLYSVVPTIAYFVGVEMHVVCDRIALIDFAGNTVHSAEYGPSYAEDDVIESVAGNIRASIGAAGIALDRITAVGVGLHGIIDQRAGLLHRILYSGQAIELRVTASLGDALGVPVYVAQPRVLVLYKEQGPAIVDMTGITVNLYHGYGLGVGIFIDGSYYRSATGMAGQIGHVPVAGNSRLCYCGNTGCLRTLVSYKGICERAQDMLRQGLVSGIEPPALQGPRYEEGVNHIIDCALQQDKLAVNLLHETGELLGNALAQVVNLFNPHRLIVHTNLLRAGELFTAPLRLATQRGSLSSSFASLTFEFTQLGPFAVAEGGGLFALCEFTSKYPLSDTENDA